MFKEILNIKNEDGKDYKITKDLIIEKILDPKIEISINIKKEFLFHNTNNQSSKYSVEVSCPNIFYWQHNVYEQEELLKNIDDFYKSFEKIAAEKFRVKLGVLSAAEELSKQIKEFIKRDSVGVIALAKKKLPRTILSVIIPNKD